MAFAPPKNLEGPKMQTKMSAWTPLNHQLMNDKVFEERRALLGKWFDKWTDLQRRRVLMDLLERCSLPQLKFWVKQLHDRVPAEALDFTSKLPKVLSLYIFSFLDPRSLCRCAQVSWHWKYLTELDQLWMPKCLRFGWYINFSPTPFEQGIWKRHYIEMAKEFLVTRPMIVPKDNFVVADVQPVAKETPEAKQSLSSILQLGKKLEKEKRGLPPWRSSDKHPMDIIRFNYLDNYDPIEQARQARKKEGGLTQDLSLQTFQKKRKPSSGTYRLRKAKSLQPSAELPRMQTGRTQMSLSTDFDSHPKFPVRPSWATHQSNGYPVTKTTAKLLAQSAQWNAGIRPAPVQGPVPKLSKKGKMAFARARSSPTSPFFESQPWEVPSSSRVSDSD
ncbi:F-box only protein 16 isoform X1 [Sphaerodactylus townsendi]|uniref:F-box only protein 16 isoform X1 n=1 Tax=Sphaerodactylus townsendi TaxID=933632 RepID=UPI00202743F3|nr:F-box only protein 16 isoform X1 [Sphaerodactylus townsendi]XP_048372769.1 F-box only protein 16 isoform X1 [Sphaerodactylus townsendi]XP_048372774.1 F-box only protein 16 isoform X1 [Sphaerodactylus townsendi]